MQCNLQGQTALCGLPSLPASVAAKTAPAGASHHHHGHHVSSATLGAGAGASLAAATLVTVQGKGADDGQEAEGVEKVPVTIPGSAQSASFASALSRDDGTLGGAGAAVSPVAAASMCNSRDTTKDAAGCGVTVDTFLTNKEGGNYFPTTTLDDYVPPECVRVSKGALNNNPALAGGGEQRRESLASPGGKMPLSDFGMEVLKVTTQGKFQPRRLAVGPDNRTILINTKRTPSIRGIFKKKPDNPLSLARRIDVSSIVRVETGQRTRKFGMARTMNEVIAHSARQGSSVTKANGGSRRNLVGNGSVTMTEEKFANSLSIVYRSTPGAVATSIFGGSSNGGGGGGGSPPSSPGKSPGKGKGSGASTSSTTPTLETLDLVVPSTRDFESLMLTLHDVMALYKKYRADTHRDVQLLQHLWIRTGLSLDARASAQDWVGPIARDGLGAPLSKGRLLKMYQAYCKRERINMGEHGGGVLIGQAVGLLRVLREAATLESAKDAADVSSNGKSKSKSKSRRKSSKASKETKDVTIIDPTQVVWNEIVEGGAGGRGPNSRPADCDIGCYEIMECPSLHQVLSAEEPFHQEAKNRDSSGNNSDSSVSEENTSAAGNTGKGKNKKKATKTKKNASSYASSLTASQKEGLSAALGAEETVSAERYLSFLRTTQGEPDATIVQVYDLFTRLNGQTKASASSALACRSSASRGGGLVATDSETVDSANELRHEKVRAAMIPKNRVARSTLLHHLLSDANDAFDPEAGASGQTDMTHPLSSYWINTSHDTYLRRALSPDGRGHGSAESDAAMYGEALRRGFRCLELDLYDGPKDSDDPVVRFSAAAGGKSISVPLKDALNEIKSFLTFHPRTFPVVLCLEDHCTLNSQDRTASLLRKVLGDRVYSPEEEEDEQLAAANLSPTAAAISRAATAASNVDNDDILPSPQSLRGRVVIKSKRPRTMREGATVLCDDFDADNDVDPSLPPPPVEDDDVSLSPEDELINPVLSMASFDVMADRGVAAADLSPEERCNLADKDASNAREAAARAEKRAFNMQVKARRAEDHSAKLLRRLGWRIDEIEERRAELQADAAEEEGMKTIQERSQSHDSVASVRSEASSSSRTVRLSQAGSSAAVNLGEKANAEELPPPQAAPQAAAVTEVNQTPNRVEDQAQIEQQRQEPPRPEMDENLAELDALVAQSGSTLFTEDQTHMGGSAGSLTMNDTLEGDRTFDDDKGTFDEKGDTFDMAEKSFNVDDVREGLLSLWHGDMPGGLTMSTINNALKSSPSNESIYNDVGISQSQSVGEATREGSTSSPAPATLTCSTPLAASGNAAADRCPSPIPEEEGLEVELLPGPTMQSQEEEEEEEESDISSPEKAIVNLPPPSPARRVLSGEAGMEVQHFFAESVNRARLHRSEADEAAMIAAKASDRASRSLRKSRRNLSEAEDVLYRAVQSERDLAQSADRSASEARSNREHADVARQRVETVRELLNTCEDQAATSETVAATAVAEAGISEERATDAERRAKRAQSNAAKERKSADEHTKEEEKLEGEAKEMKKESREATEKAREKKVEHDKLVEALDKVEEQVAILEENNQFRKESAQSEAQAIEGTSGGSGSDSLSLPLVRRHHEKTIERSELRERLAKAASELEASEISRKSLEEAHFNIRSRFQSQAKTASAARRQADQSTTVAEQLAEYAEEEREAANMRSDARDKAEACVNRSGTHSQSMEAQLAEAERAAEEADELAKSSREVAEKLAAEAAAAKDISRQQEEVERCREEKRKAEATLEAGVAVREAADHKAGEARQHLETAYEVFYQAKRVSTAETHRFNAERRVEQNAIEAHDTAVESRRKAEDAKSQASDAVLAAAEKVSGAKRARDYRDKKAKVQAVSLDLAKMTAFHSSKFNYWEKSMAIPASHMHSISEGRMIQLTTVGTDNEDVVDLLEARENWIEFNKSHITRVFPSRHGRLRAAAPNFNPVVSWSLGCQMVAVNFQACDDNLLLNDGRFRANASSGYVLKPERLTDGRRGATAEGSRSRRAIAAAPGSPIDPVVPCRLRFRVLSGYNIPAPENRMGRSGPISPRIRVALYDAPAPEAVEGGSAPQVHLTEKVKRNGLNPVWNEERGASFYASAPDVAMLLVTVWDSGDDGVSRDDFIGAASMPVSCVREGYRSVPLFDAKHSRSGCHAFSSLLVKIESRQ